MSEFIEEFVEEKTWLVRENANLRKSFASLFFRLAGKSIEKYLLEKYYPKKIARAHIEGDLHIHNLYMGMVGYCAGWSLLEVYELGILSPPLKIPPPKNLAEAYFVASNFLGAIQSEWAGAQAFNSFDTLTSKFARGEKYEKVKGGMRMFIQNLNLTSRWGGQSPFTNLTFDLVPPEDLKVFDEFVEEMGAINRAFLEIMLEGDAEHRPYTFPIPTYNITKDFPWDSEIADLIFELAAKYGSPYFANFVNSDLSPSDVRSMCCRLRLDLRELKRNITSGLFGSGDKTGSIGVVTLNMPRVGYLSKDDDEFFERVEKLMEIAKEALLLKRDLVQKLMEAGMLPYTKQYLGTLDYHFNTIGLIGMHEACLNFLGEGIWEKEAKRFSEKVLDFMLSKLKEFQMETGLLWNLEATPAEGASYRLARLDKKYFKDIETSGEKVPYYTNSTWLPVGYTDDIFEVLDHQESLQTRYTGGTVVHIWIGERIDGEAAKELVRKIFNKYRVPYITLTPTYSVCRVHGIFYGEHEKCPVCGAKTEVYSRVVGYLRPVSQWNEGKQEEFRERKHFKV